MTGVQQIRVAVLEQLVAHARREAPLECCGLLVSDAEGRPIDEGVPTRNLRESPRAYLVDPVEHFALLRRVRAEGRRIAGAYHSHPASPAQPSASDLAEAHYPEFVYLIVSLQDAARPDVRAFRIEGGGFEEVVLVVR